MELSNEHVALPREDFIELSRAAYEPQPTPADRVASTAQTFMVFGGLAAGVTAGAFGISKATDWLEERRIKRADRHLKTKTAPEQS